MTAERSRPRVVVAGGGVAALELLLALRVIAGSRLEVTVVSGEPELAPQAMTVAEPFQRGGARRFAWSQIAADQRAGLVVDRVVAVDPVERALRTHGGRRLRYDVLALATGARREPPFAGALTFGGGGPAASARLREQVAVLEPRGDGIVFALPSPSSWPLPLYELALMTAQALRERGGAAAVRIVTPEVVPLELFGPAASAAIAPLLDGLGVEVRTGAQPRKAARDGLRLDDGELVRAQAVVTVAEVVGRPLPGLPVDRGGFVPVDLHGRVVGEPALFAAGEATSFPLRQGGLATQQADAAAAAIAAACGIDCGRVAFRPVLRGQLLTSGAPLYLQSRPSGQSVASTRALWSPPEKVAGRYLAPYLGTARPGRLAAAPLSERFAAPARDAGDDEDACRLARALADAEARCGNRARALQALEAARALEPARAHEPESVVLHDAVRVATDDAAPTRP